jgi:hypothetical protein
MAGAGTIGIHHIGVITWAGVGIIGMVQIGVGDGIPGTALIGDGDGIIGTETVFMALDGVAIITIGVGVFTAEM